MRRFHSWLSKCMMMFVVAKNVEKALLQEKMKDRTGREQKLGTVRIKRISQGYSLSSSLLDLD